jgi:hypothetical protein
MKFDPLRQLLMFDCPRGIHCLPGIEAITIGEVVGVGSLELVSLADRGMNFVYRFLKHGWLLVSTIQYYLDSDGLLEAAKRLEIHVIHVPSVIGERAAVTERLVAIMHVVVGARPDRKVVNTFDFVSWHGDLSLE